MVTEKIQDWTKADAGVVRGTVSYTYESPTHWGSDGICSVTVEYGYPSPRAKLNWSAGGVNKGFGRLDVARAMAEAFTLAASRLEVLAAQGCEV